MKKTNDPYIKMLEEGINLQVGGITYNNMITLLRLEHDINLSNLNQETLMDWFFENFYNAEVEKYKLAAIGTPHIQTDKVFKDNLDKTAYIKGNAVMRMLDYWELHEARKSSRQAAIIAIIAIFISAGFALIQIIGS